MNLSPDDLLVFARVAEAGSFSRAADRLGLPKSTVSRRVSGLEAALGERVLTRSTRRLALTDFGRALLDHARRVVEETDAARALAQHRQAEPSGRLRVSMPHDFAAWLLPSTLARFGERYPRVSVELDLSPRRVDLLGENFDLAIRMGALPDDATLVARRLCEFRRGLYASRDYLARHGMPRQPDDLGAHTALRLLTQGGEPGPWELRRGDESWSGTPPGRVAVNSVGMLMRLAEEGAGIALLAEPYLSAQPADGGLVPVLPDWRPPSVVAWAVLPGRRLLPAKTRAFLDALAETLGTA